MVWGWVALGVSIFQGIQGRSSSRRAGRAAREAAFANAADLRELAGENADAYLYAGEVNAGAVEAVGEVNALAIERATERNMMLYAMQADEERRRMIIQQKQLAGAIRARTGASGVQTNTGSPRDFLVGQIKLGIMERRYSDLRTYWTLRNMAEEGSDRAHVTRFTAEQEAMVIRTNAEISADISLRDAERQATAMERGGVNAQSTANSEGAQHLLAGIGGAIGSYASYNSGPSVAPTSRPYSNIGMTGYSNQFSSGPALGFNMTSNTNSWGNHLVSTGGGYY